MCPEIVHARPYRGQRVGGYIFVFEREEAVEPLPVKLRENALHVESPRAEHYALVFGNAEFLLVLEVQRRKFALELFQRPDWLYGA